MKALAHAREFAKLSRAGTFTPGVDTSPHLRVYTFPVDFDPIAWAATQGYRVEVFSFAPERFRAPNLKTNGYANGTVWIYDPEVNEGAFRAHDIGLDASIQYTRNWRVTHEVAHAQTECQVQALYGDSRRNGRLGRPMVQTVGNPEHGVVRTIPGLTLAQAKRAVHWEHLAFKRQWLLMRNAGCEISRAQFANEYNTNLTDAIARACSGEFLNPGPSGWLPNCERLARLDDALAYLEIVQDRIDHARSQ